MTGYLPFKGTREPANLIPNLGQNRAGQSITDGKTIICFDKNGFPEFESKFETLLEGSNIGSGRPDLHFREANQRLFDAIQADPALAQALRLSQEQVRKLSARRAPVGYAWHHHLAIPHIGGMAIWGGGYPP
ncbi:HNH endonuclease [Stigmatella sp. ncwal1]|uniref:HNH endonuclease n=1 Tax=Stigmatella ashevillensis TaxID=2995309 RepID=A0ABT5DIK5_9BACT|nr:HNH endonuclease [Stigmatella ashevillena]MDC0712985.1 HNH endonuclease [Stigmatella ashevillena]